MTEIKLDYSVNYRETVAERERRKYDDLLRLAAERASMILDLQAELKAAKEEAERLKAQIKLTKDMFPFLRDETEEPMKEPTTYQHFDFVIENMSEPFAEFLMELILAFAEFMGLNVGGGYHPTSDKDYPEVGDEQD